MADAVEATELFDIDVDQFAGMLALVAANRRGGFERLDAGEAENVAGETPTAAAICWPVQRWRRRASTVATMAAGVGLWR